MKWIEALCLIFVLHGMLYYLDPGQNYMLRGASIGWIAPIKYIVLGALLLLTLRCSPWQDLRSFFIGLITPSLTIAILALNFEFHNLLLIQFFLCSLAYFATPALARVWSDSDKIAVSAIVVILFAVLSIIFETLFGQVGVFSRNGFRAIGPFSNPNNTGIVLSICLAAYYLSRGKMDVVCGAVFLITAGAIFLTGSKTAIILCVAIVLMAINLRWLLVLLAICVVSAIGISILFSYIPESISLREFNFISALARIDDFKSLVASSMKFPVTDIFWGFSTVSIIDNAYFDIWTFGGGALVLEFVCIQIGAIYMCVKSRNRKLVLIHVLFVLAMLTTNVPRLWPTGYMYWVLVGVSFYRASERGVEPLGSPSQEKYAD